MNLNQKETNSPELSRRKKWPSPLNTMRIEFDREAHVNRQVRDRLTIKPRITLGAIAERVRDDRLVDRNGGHASLIERSGQLSVGF